MLLRLRYDRSLFGFNVPILLEIDTHKEVRREVPHAAEHTTGDAEQRLRAWARDNRHTIVEGWLTALR